MFDNVIITCKNYFGEGYAPQNDHRREVRLSKQWKEKVMTPSTRGLSALVRQSPLTNEDWFNLVEARRELIKPYLDSFTLPELGSLKCLRSELSFAHSLRHDAPKCSGDQRLSLATQGIFCEQPYGAIEKIPNSGYCAPPGGVSCPSGTKLIWGLTRTNLWVLARICFVGESGYKERGYERAQTVEISESNPVEIAARTKEKLERMWEELGKAIKEWAQRRKQLCDEAANLSMMVGIEELALSKIPTELVV